MAEKVIKSYKGFDPSLSCRDFQYEVGKEYEMNGHIECCKRGFHACESPLEVFDHYDMLKSRFAEVEQSGTIDREENSTKVCSSRIKIKAELKLADKKIEHKEVKENFFTLSLRSLRRLGTFIKNSFNTRKHGSKD